MIHSVKFPRAEVSLRSRHLVYGMLLLILAAAHGCGPASAPPSDAQAATTLISDTLDAWAAGKSVAQMREQTPAVYVAEELWLKGATLDSYEITDPAETFGTNIRFRVVLRCADEKGKLKEHAVKYLVTTTPAFTISREDR